jgi:hypothetical protein
LILYMGAAFMVLLGFARGAGGLVLLGTGAAADPRIRASAAAVSAVGATLLLVGLALVVAAAGMFRRLRRFRLLGMISTGAFVVDGAINGYVLYGRPGGWGTVGNLAVAAVILACLVLGGDALPDSVARPDDAADDASRRR